MAPSRTTDPPALFLLTALIYPAVLAALLVGAGLLVDRCCDGHLPGALLLSVGAAALIAVSQLASYLSPIASATPYLMVAFAAAGYATGRERTVALLARARESGWLVAVPVLAFVLALAPVLLAGRATFSAYLTISDSAAHMIGADYLIRHGMEYAHLDLRNSYGQVIDDYYNSSYPSGADTLFGGSAAVLGLPLIWAFQPFNALMLASATGPAWMLCRRIGLEGVWAACAALSVTLPALVYGYALSASIKEITALSMILTLGALTVAHRSWLHGQARRTIPFAVVLAAGVSALGVAFGAWSLTVVAVLLAIAFAEMRSSRRPASRMLLRVAVGALVALVCAWPTVRGISGSLQVAQNIASTTNPGDLTSRLRSDQVLGVWLSPSYREHPAGAILLLTEALELLVALGVALGAVQLARVRAFALAAWLGLMLLAWLAVTAYVTSWADAKALMLTSPILVLMAWGGVALLRGTRLLRQAAALLAIVLCGGVVASDAMQYNATNLAPTGRYDELASIDTRFAGDGPTVFTDFDEFALYALRDMDVAGPSFRYGPTALDSATRGHGHPVELDRVPPGALRGYPLIVTRIDPSAPRPPSAYALVWQGSSYQVWQRLPAAPVASSVVALSGSTASQCARVGQLARGAHGRGASLVASVRAAIVPVALRGARVPAGWEPHGASLSMSRPGTLSVSFALPHPGVWNVWLKGQFMPGVRVSVDGRSLASLGGSLDGNDLITDAVGPLPVRLAAGSHRLSLSRVSSPLAPGDSGSAELSAIFLTPSGIGSEPVLRSAPVARWRSLCGLDLQWVELVGGATYAG